MTRKQIEALVWLGWAQKDIRTMTASVEWLRRYRIRLIEAIEGEGLLVTSNDGHPCISERGHIVIQAARALGVRARQPGVDQVQVRCRCGLRWRSVHVATSVPCRRCHEYCQRVSPRKIS